MIFTSTCLLVWGIGLRQVLLCILGQDTQGEPDRLHTRLGHTRQAEGLTSGQDRLKDLRGGPNIQRLKEQSR